MHKYISTFIIYKSFYFNLSINNIFFFNTKLFDTPDFFRPRIDILEEAGIKSGYHVLDYGCGSGSYIVDTARLVGGSVMVYALDVHPLA
ncbi:MAG: hypothetical protein ACXVHV_11745, partial [Methanobacterium sp.]